MQTYDPTRVKLNIAGITVVGFAPGTFVKVSRNEDLMMLQMGADGIGCRTKNANKSGKIEITLQASSPTNDALSALVQLDEDFGAGVGGSLLNDLNGTTLASAQNSWIVKPADIERAKETGEVTWSIETDLLNTNTGGTFNIPNVI